VTTRETTEDDWGAPVNLGTLVNSGANDRGPSISADALELFFHSSRSGGSGVRDIWVTMRTTTEDPWGKLANLGPIVNSSSEEVGPSISADGLSLFFASNRPGGYGSADVWVTTRDTMDNEWGAPVNLGPPVNSWAEEFAPSISPDGRTLYFTSDRPGGLGQRDVWQVRILPLVDFNGDGSVDIKDLLRLIQSWGQDDPLVDIAPLPFGDRVVSALDVELLMSYWEQPVDDPTLVAHWALDETEGDIAFDSAGLNDAFVFGGALWQPSAGHVDGAIQLDGSDDVLVADAPLNPADGPFSVFAWIKGGTPGQVIISQVGGANWLCADALEGNLMTDLKYVGGRLTEPPLASRTLITDDAWHRVALSWDGKNRILYVDGVEVAKDTQPGFVSLEGDLYIGTGKDMALGTCWSGLIDDIRIYNRAVSP
jgi:hypothetical protein